MSTNNGRVSPKLSGGMRDFMPDEALARQEMLDTVRKVFERFGFVPIKTPAIELMSVLTGDNPDFDMSIFEVGIRSAREREKLGLRFDHTVPLARFIAGHYNELRFPFKRYAYGEVWRGEKPQAGRYREFGQFDADIAGSSSMLADAEIIALMVATMQALGVTKFKVRYNNRKLLDGLPAYAGYDPELHKQVLRVIDKLEKTGPLAFRKELTAPLPPADLPADSSAEDEEGQPAPVYGLGLSEEAVNKILEIADRLTMATTDDEELKRVGERFAGIKVAEEGLAELMEVRRHLVAMGVEDHVIFDSSIARGLDYYTGTVFETFLQELPEFGSVFSGGRFDGLVGNFLDASIPAVGASIGIDRLFAALTKLGQIEKKQSVVDVFMTVMDPGLIDDYLEMVRDLRRKYNTVIWMGEDKSFRAQLAYAAKEDIPIVIIMGPDEAAAGKVKVKFMRRREQFEVPRDGLHTILRVQSWS